MTSRAPSRPSSVKCSLLSPSPLVSNSSICCSNRALEAILAILSIWRSSPFGGFGTTYRGRLRHLTFTACRGRDPSRRRPERRVDPYLRVLPATAAVAEMLVRRSLLVVHSTQQELVLIHTSGQRPLPSR